MTPSFTPLNPNAPADRPASQHSRIKVLSGQGCHIQPIPLDQSAESPPPSPNSKQSPATPAPTVNLIRENDRVSRIQVRCSCGEVIELECQY